MIARTISTCATEPAAGVRWEDAPAAPSVGKKRRRKLIGPPVGKAVRSDPRDAADESSVRCPGREDSAGAFGRGEGPDYDADGAADGATDGAAELGAGR